VGPGAGGKGPSGGGSVDGGNTEDRTGEGTGASGECEASPSIETCGQADVIIQLEVSLRDPPAVSTTSAGNSVATTPSHAVVPLLLTRLETLDHYASRPTSSFQLLGAGKHCGLPGGPGGGGRPGVHRL